MLFLLFYLLLLMIDVSMSGLLGDAQASVFVFHSLLEFLLRLVLAVRAVAIGDGGAGSSNNDSN